MNHTELVNNPHYPALMALANQFDLDESIVEEMVLGVIARLEIAIENDIKPTTEVVMHAMEHWFDSRRKLAEQYETNATFRAQINQRIYNNITGEQ